MIYYVYGAPYTDELYHFGIKGQKWGIRRFQNEDGSLTTAGKERYRKNSDSTNGNTKMERRRGIDKDKVKKAAKIAGAAVGTAVLGYGAYKFSKSNMAKEFMLSTRLRATMARNASLVSLHKLSNDELAEKLGRLKLIEDIRNTTYREITSSPNPRNQMCMDAGKKVIGAAIAGIASYAGYAAMSKTFDRKQAAAYVFQNPNKKNK